MIAPDGDPDRPAEDAGTPPAALSVDQLTQAFAQLMGRGDDHASGSAVKHPTDAGEPGASELAVPDDAEDQDAGHVTPAAVVEAVLFVGHPQNEPLTGRQIASYLRGVSPQEVDALIEQLNAQYDEHGAAYRIVSEGAGYRMTLRGEFNRLRDAFYGRVREARLSQAAVDLLAIVAYHQPITREAIDQLRDQSSGATLGQLVRRQLLQVELSTDKPRRKIYRTTDRFLDVFGLESLDDLPSQEDF